MSDINKVYDEVQARRQSLLPFFRTNSLKRIPGYRDLKMRHKIIPRKHDRNQCCPFFMVDGECYEKEIREPMNSHSGVVTEEEFNG